MQMPFCAIMRSWTLLAAFGGSYAPDMTYIDTISYVLKVQYLQYIRYSIYIWHIHNITNVAVLSGRAPHNSPVSECLRGPEGTDSALPNSLNVIPQIVNPTQV